MGRIILIALVLTAPLGAQRGEIAFGPNGTIYYETAQAPLNPIRTASLFKLLFDTVASDYPDEIQIHVMRYANFELELARYVAGPSWETYLYSLRSSSNAPTTSGFVEEARVSDRVLVIRTWQAGDETLIHETTHYICHHWSPDLNFGLHRQGMDDCTRALSSAFWHSPIYRNWLREQPWRR